LKEHELVILGAGPAGLAAAVEAVQAGASVTPLANHRDATHVHVHLEDAAPQTCPESRSLPRGKFQSAPVTSDIFLRGRRSADLTACHYLPMLLWD